MVDAEPVETETVIGEVWADKATLRASKKATLRATRRPR
jgi:hypothetical protein